MFEQFFIWNTKGHFYTSGSMFDGRKWKDMVYQLFNLFLLKKSMAFKFTILNSVHLIMFCAMFGLNWICGTEEVKYVKKSL